MRNLTDKQFLLLVFLFSMWCQSLRAQQRDIDTVMTEEGPDGTFYSIVENPVGKPFFGNSLYTGLNYTWGRSNQFGIDLGRTLGRGVCGGGGCYVSMLSWGANYTYARKQDFEDHLVGVFTEFSAFPLPLASARLDLQYSILHSDWVVRPALGLSFFALDVLYSYGFSFGPSSNMYHHGLTLRIKGIFWPRNWQKRAYQFVPADQDKSH